MQPTAKNIGDLLTAAMGHHRAERLDAAEKIYRDILEADPKQIDALHYLGVLANQRGDHTRAVTLIGQAIALNGQAAHFHNNIAAAYRALKDADKSRSHYQQAIALKPDYAEAYGNLAGLLADQGNAEDAEAHARRAVGLKPEYAKAHYALGSVLQKQHKETEAAACYEQALALNPNYAEAWNNLGVIHKDQGRLAEAIPCFERALALRPSYANAVYNFGLTREEQGRLDEALSHYQRAAVLSPEDADSHWNEALVRLLLGDFAGGWRKYEWRLRRESPRQFEAPRWEGGDLAGRTILLHAEQGHGDAIQFVRYARLVKERGARVVVECQPTLVRLLATAPGVDEVVTPDKNNARFDCHAPLMSLPFLFKTIVESIPAEVPYLRPQTDDIAKWRARLGPGRTVGVVWRGNPGNKSSAKRSLPAEAIGRLCTTPGIHWVSLQADATPDDLEKLRHHGGSIQDAGSTLGDWADTAALVSVLDLVITVDTGVAHLVGALARPGWLLLPWISEWRWLQDRDDSPWYPSLKLFRQPAAGDWESVIANVRQHLSQLVLSRSDS